MLNSQLLETFFKFLMSNIELDPRFCRHSKTYLTEEYHAEVAAETKYTDM